MFAATVDRFEQLQKTASELVGAEDLDDVLDRITHHVSVALDGPRYLLVARLHDRDVTRVHHRGFRGDAAAEAAEALLAGVIGEQDGVLIADVASKRRSFGKLAAFFGAGTELKRSDQRLLEAYAGHAAAALEVISSLEEARRERDTARALLELASALAEVGTIDEIAGRLTEAVPAVVGSDLAAMWLLNADGDRIVLRGWRDTDPSAASPPKAVYDMETLPELTDLLDRPRAMILAREEAPSAMRGDLEALGLEEIAVVPITSKGSLRGLVVAGFRRPLSAEATTGILSRLAGLADHAATAVENAELLAQAKHEAMHDRLTGLPNRPLVEDRGQQAFATARRSGRSVGLLFVDLDRFKIVNDTLGHRAGDELIRQVADRMQAQMRAADTLARLGGDEFVVLLPELDHGVEDAAIVAGRLIDALRAPFSVAGQELFVSCSIGVACSPDHGENYETLMQYGDAAMYAAKASGRGAFAVHGDRNDLPRRSQLALESQLHRALDNDELLVHYQPQVDLRTMRVTSVEALVRWEHPTLGLLGPAAFLSLAEESGLIVDIDSWVRRTAFAQAKTWCDAGRPLGVAVNLSTRALANPTLASVIAGEMEDAGVPAHLVELEVTDRVVMSEDELPAVLDSLKALGVRLAIDDFGTGTSVLGRLESCRVDTLKIDASFLQGITREAPEAPLVKAIIALAHSLGLAVVGEGVETPEQGGALRRYGCEMVQGYLFSRPVPAEEIDRLVAGGVPAAV
jgi:diguanylate cyclase (GGDEF)-like protein